MKTVSLLSVLMIAVCLVGCQDSELATCQQEREALQEQVTEKDNQISTLKAENVEIQTKAMESIATIMQKQAKRNDQLKDSIAEKIQQVKDLEEKVASLEIELENLKNLYENATATIGSLEKEKQALAKKINDIQKAALSPVK
ncbi:MAG: hypothetical protein ABFR90_09665 [Planctomycetota bacterium]